MFQNEHSKTNTSRRFVTKGDKGEIENVDLIFNTTYDF